jgi:pyridinium-3,5-biscarboxylic acid mononucleotide synthase
MSFVSARSILRNVKSGKLSIARAERALRLDVLSIVDEIARLDINRYARRGVPEIIYAEGKTEKQLVSILNKLIKDRQRTREKSPIILSKISIERAKKIQSLLKKNASVVGGRFHFYESARISSIEFAREESSSHAGGRVGLLAAGTSDIPLLDEAEVVLKLMGSQTLRFNDVGIASLTRLKEPLRELLEFDPDAIVVAAGMEAALPSLIAGLSSVPIVGLPTSIGFGFGSRGEAALMSMLQACPLGICTVNIDGGVAAGIISNLIASRCAASRSEGHGRKRFRSRDI